MNQRFTFFLLMSMCLFEAHAQVKSAALPVCGSLPTPAFTNQSVTVRSGTTADVSLAWTNVGATTYEVFFKLSSETQFSASCVTSSVNCTVGGLQLGRTYNIRVEAHRDCQFSPGEEDEDVTSVNTTVTLPQPAPPAPTGLRATTIGHQAFVAFWDLTTGADSYTLDVSKEDDFLPVTENIITNLPLAGNNHVVKDLEFGKDYFFRVRAVNSTGISPYSATFRVTTRPAQPSDVTASSISESSFVASWSPVRSAISYKVEVSPESSPATIHTSVTIPGTSLTVDRLEPNTGYILRVQTINAGGTSDIKEIRVRTLLSAPINLGANSITANSFVATWSSVAGAASYRLDVSSCIDTSCQHILTDFPVPNIDPAVISQSVTGLASSTTYSFRVRSVNASGVSASSPEFLITTLPTPPPVITSFAPSSGPVGTSVALTGSFNPDPAKNIVFFGATRATITAFSPVGTSMTVKVPFGATFEPISVTDVATQLTGYSVSPFITTFSPAGQTLNSNSFGPKVKLESESMPSSIKTTDLNGDGKPDMIVAKETSLTIYRNTSLRGSLDNSSFVLSMNIVFPRLHGSIAISDFDGDGKPDIVVRSESNTISVFLNETLPGTSSFSFSRSDFATDHQINALAAGDLDGDGRPDLALIHALPLVNGASVNAVTILRNNGGNTGLFSTSGISFPAGRNCISIAIADLDDDRKPEIVVVDNILQNVSVLKNTSVQGAISFTPKIDFKVPGGQNVVTGDLDGNGKQELVVAGLNKVSVLDNAGLLSFAPLVDYAVTAFGFSNLAISDLNGDAKPEIMASDVVLKNTSVSGSGRSSFASGIKYLPGEELTSVGVIAGDLDNDGKPDLLSANRLNGTPTSEIVFLQNNLVSDSIANVFVTNPAHGATGILNSVDVTAKSLSGASTYTIQVSPTQDFSSGVLEKSGVRGQRFTGLTYGIRYFTRVKTNLSPKFGKTTSFNTVPAEDLAFVTSPANGAVDQSPNLTVASNTVAGATSYTIELNTSPSFDGVSIVKTGIRTQNFTGLSYNTTYYSRVRTEFTQNWGQTRSFTITDASKITFITSPADGATGQPTTLNLICSQVPGATAFTVFLTFQDQETGVFDVLTFTSNSRTVRASGLRPNTLYEAKVVTNLSPLFGPVRTFTTGAALGALAAYPNPASDQVTIKNIKPGSQIKIVDAISATLVETIHATGEEFTIETVKYRRGLYYVIQVNADGSESESIKLSVN